MARALTIRRREAREVSMNQMIKGLIYYAEEFYLQTGSKIVYEERKMIIGMELKVVVRVSNSNYWKGKRPHKRIPKRHHGSLL